MSCSAMDREASRQFFERLGSGHPETAWRQQKNKIKPQKFVLWVVCRLLEDPAAFLTWPEALRGEHAVATLWGTIDDCSLREKVALALVHDDPALYTKLLPLLMSEARKEVYETLLYGAWRCFRLFNEQYGSIVMQVLKATPTMAWAKRIFPVWNRETTTQFLACLPFNKLCYDEGRFQYSKGMVFDQTWKFCAIVQKDDALGRRLLENIRESPHMAPIFTPRLLKWLIRFYGRRFLSRVTRMNLMLGHCGRLYKNNDILLPFHHAALPALQQDKRALANLNAVHAKHSFNNKLLTWAHLQIVNHYNAMYMSTSFFKPRPIVCPLSEQPDGLPVIHAQKLSPRFATFFPVDVMDDYSALSKYRKQDEQVYYGTAWYQLCGRESVNGAQFQAALLNTFPEIMSFCVTLPLDRIEETQQAMIRNERHNHLVFG